MGEAELLELVRMYPSFISDSIEGYLSSTGASPDVIADLEVEIGLREGTAQVRLSQLPELQEQLIADLTSRQVDTLQVASAHR